MNKRKITFNFSLGFILMAIGFILQFGLKTTSFIPQFASILGASIVLWGVLYLIVRIPITKRKEKILISLSCGVLFSALSFILNCYYKTDYYSLNTIMSFVGFIGLYLIAIGIHEAIPFKDK